MYFIIHSPPFAESKYFVILVLRYADLAGAVQVSIRNAW